MKKIKFVLFSLSLIFLAPEVHAYSAIYMTPDQAFGMVGQKGIVMEVQDSTVEPDKLANGWSAEKCTLTGIVIKGNDEVTASDDVQKYTFHTMSRIKGVMPCRKGMKGIYSVFGKSKYGLATFVGGEGGQIPYVEGADNKLYSSKSLRISDKAMAAKFSAANPGAAKALGSSTTAPATAGAPGARAQSMGPSIDNTRVFTKFLIQQYWPSK